MSVEGLTAPLKVFEGSAREAIAGFPANVNVAVALSLAGVGPDRTRVEIWADPGVTRNTHTIRRQVGFLGPDHDDREHPVRRTRAPAASPR